MNINKKIKNFIISIAVGATIIFGIFAHFGVPLIK